MRTRHWLIFAALMLVEFSVLTPRASAQERNRRREHHEIDPASVQRFGAGWKRSQAGWLVVHIEGSPYERGLQHGRLLAREIVDYLQTLARTRSHKDPVAAWNSMRLLTDATFARRFDAECLEEMRGIADGAASVGATFDGRRLDLLDIVAINADVEVGFLESALQATPNGIDSRKFPGPTASPPPVKKPERCSAFVATTPATDPSTGGVMLGHITFSSLSWVYHFNIWLDVTPTDAAGKPTGHRFVCQSFPGGIQSGLDYYVSASGLLITETTIDQTRFNVAGETEASRIRRAVQYATTIDDVVKILASQNNGLYTNEWLIADTKTNEIAMFELGTTTTRLWRSSRQEWFGDTPGFYWGCNNAKDRTIQSDTIADLRGKPGNLVLHPSRRDVAWQALFHAHRQPNGLTEEFGFEAFRTPPIAGYFASDAKFTTAAMAKDLSSWTLFGPPLGHVWPPSSDELATDPEAKPLVSHGWTMIRPDQPLPKLDAGIRIADQIPFPDSDEPTKLKFEQRHPFAWRGTLLPQTAAEAGLVAAFAEFEKIASLEKALQVEHTAKKLGSGETAKAELDQAARDLVDVALFTHQSNWWAARQRLGRDVTFSQTKPEEDSLEWYPIALGQGVALFAELRSQLGHDTFDKLLDDFGSAKAGQAVRWADFRAAITMGQPKAATTFEKWSDRAVTAADHVAGHWSIYSFEPEPDDARIVIGNSGDRVTNREIGKRLQHAIARRWGNYRIPIVAEDDLSDAVRKSNHLLVVGEPSTNSLLLKAASKSPVKFQPHSFTVRGDTFSNLDSAVIVASENPWNSRYSCVIFAGLSARATHRIVDSLSPDEETSPQVVVFPANQPARRFVVSGRTN